MRFELSFLYVCGAEKRTIINVSRATTTTTMALSLYLHKQICGILNARASGKKTSRRAHTTQSSKIKMHTQQQQRFLLPVFFLNFVS